jgi:hypothetical protein
MRHLRPLPPIDDPDHQWSLVSETVVFAATPEGLQQSKWFLEYYYRTNVYEDAPVDLVLCTGAIEADGPYTPVRQVKRPIDLLDDWAPIGSDAPDPSLKEMKENYGRLKKRQKNGEFEDSQEEAKMYLQQIEDDILRIEASLEELVAEQKPKWEGEYPALYPVSAAP